MAAAAPDEILTRRSPKVPNSWHMRVPNINSVRAGRSSPVSLSPKIKNESLWKESYERARSDLYESFEYDSFGQRDESFREDHHSDWYLRIHQGAKSVHTPERTTRRKMNVIF